MNQQCILKVDGKEYGAQIIDDQASVAVPGSPDYQFLYDKRTQMWEIFHDRFDTTGVDTTGMGVDVRKPAFPDGARYFAVQLANALNQRATPNSTTVTVGGKEYRLTYGNGIATTDVDGKKYSFIWDQRGGWQIFYNAYSTSRTRITGMGVVAATPDFPEGIPHLAYEIVGEMNRRLKQKPAKPTGIRQSLATLVANARNMFR